MSKRTSHSPFPAVQPSSREIRPLRRRRACRRRRGARAGAAVAERRRARRPRRGARTARPARNWSRSAPSSPSSDADAIVISPVPHSRSPASRSAGIGLDRERATVARHRLPRRPVERDAPGVEQHRALAQPLDRGSVVRDEDDRAARLLEGEDPPEALPLERLVADGKDLVEEEDVGVEEGSDREAEPHGHPGRVGANRPVDRVLELGEGDDLVEALADVLPPQALDRPVQVDVLAAAEVGVEAGAELQQRADPALRPHPARRRLDDPRDDPEQRRLSRAVAADEADGLTARDVERDVLQCPARRSPRSARAGRRDP